MIGGDHHGAGGRNARHVLGHRAISHIQQGEQALERVLAAMAFCVAAGRLRHAAQPVDHQEHLNGRLNRRQKALERWYEREVNGLSSLARRLGGSGFAGLRVIVALAVDRRHLRAHGPQINR